MEWLCISRGSLRSIGNVGRRFFFVCRANAPGQDDLKGSGSAGMLSIDPPCRLGTGPGMLRRIRGILFDLGDTLLDFGEVDVLQVFRSGAELAYEYLQSLHQPLPSFNRFHRRQLRAIRWRYLISRITGREFSSLEVLSRLGRRMGHALTHEQNLELSWLWYKPLRKLATVEAGALEMLRSFAHVGLVLGVVSNTFIPGEVLDRHLRQEDLLDLLPMRVYSSEIVYRKPHRKIFELGLSRADLRAGETLFVGDSLKADIRGANRAGLISVLKDPDNRHGNSRIRPNHRIRSITELAGVVSQYNDS